MSKTQMVEKEMKKIFLIALAAIAVFIGGIKAAGSYIKSSATPSTSTPPITTSVPNVFDNINLQIADLNKVVISLQTSDQVTAAKLDQIYKLLQNIEAEVAAIKR